MVCIIYDICIKIDMIYYIYILELSMVYWAKTISLVSVLLIRMDDATQESF